MRSVILSLLIATCGIAQELPRNRFTFSGGWTREIGGYRFEKDTATGLGVSYGRRLSRFVEAEGGVFTGLQPRGQGCNSHGCVDPDDRYIWVPFGLRFIAPVIPGRLELSAGGGGLYEKYSIGNPTFNYTDSPYHGWGGYFVGGVAVGLTKHFWLGGGPRFFLANPEFRRDRWMMLAGEVSWKF